MWGGGFGGAFLVEGGFLTPQGSAIALPAPPPWRTRSNLRPAAPLCCKAPKPPCTLTHAATAAALCREAFVGPFDVANKVVEMLMMRGGCDVCCTTPADAERMARYNASSGSDAE